MTKLNATMPRMLAISQQLGAQMEGLVFLPHDDGYRARLQIWNGAVAHRPALIAQCRTSGDVQCAIRIARQHGIPLSVRGGGHDWAGRALKHNGLVIDLSDMRRVEVDGVAAIARVEGGATAADLVNAAAPHGLVAVTGTNGSVGLAGLTLGGGYGPLNGRHGLALDNLLGVEIVLASGLLVTANATENPALFWAVRGGGGNFGVVTGLRVRLHNMPEVLSGLILFPWAEADSVLRGYADILATIPDDLTILAGIISDPAGNPVLFLAPTWCGDTAQGEQIIARLCDLGRPLFVQTGAKTYRDMLGMFDAQIIAGRHYEIRSHQLRALTPAAITALVLAGHSRTSPFSAVAIHHFHGASTRVPLSATAFGLRQEHFLVQIVAGWEPVGGDDGSSHRRWCHAVSHMLASIAMPGGYPNMLAA
jgi:hypothetical protein